MLTKPQVDNAAQRVLWAKEQYESGRLSIHAFVHICNLYLDMIERFEHD